MTGCVLLASGKKKGKMLMLKTDKSVPPLLSRVNDSILVRKRREGGEGGRFAVLQIRLAVSTSPVLSQPRRSTQTAHTFAHAYTCVFVYVCVCVCVCMCVCVCVCVLCIAMLEDSKGLKTAFLSSQHVLT